MRENYEITLNEFNAIVEAFKLGGLQAVDVEWEKLAKRMGFNPNTCRDIRGKYSRFFTAEPVETAEMVRVSNSELAKLVAVAAVLDDKWPDSVHGLLETTCFSDETFTRIKTAGVRLIDFADSVKRRDRLGL